jgi:hypothetical protein
MLKMETIVGDSAEFISREIDSATNMLRWFGLVRPKCVVSDHAHNVFKAIRDCGLVPLGCTTHKCGNALRTAIATFAPKAFLDKLGQVNNTL